MSHKEQDRSPALTLRQVLEERDEQLCRALGRLDGLERVLAGIESFEFISALPKDVVDLQEQYQSAALRASGITSRDHAKPIVVPPEPLAAHIYDVGRTANFIHAFRWTRKKAIAECLGSLRYSLEHDALLPALVLTRTILEQIGTSALFHRDVSRIAPADESPEAGSDWVLEVLHALAPRAMGSRIDWAEYLASGLKGKRRKAYEVKEGRADLTAKDLLNGIDLVDKSVPGVRNAYEFLSEYAHPNYGSYQLGVVSLDVTRHRHGFRMIRKVYGGDRAPGVSVEDIGLLLRDVWELLVASIEYFLALDEKYADLQNQVGKRTKFWVRHMIRRRRWRSLFRSADACPCLSGKILGGCCGKIA